MNSVFLRGTLSASLIAFAALVYSGTADACWPGDSINVAWKGKWYPATVRKGNGSKCYITYNGYDSSWDEWVGQDRVSYNYGPGSAVRVLWKGKWYNAQVRQANGKQYFITYDGYDNSWDEWVGPNRLRSR